MKDNSNTLSIEAKMTRLGKKRLAENRFNPTKFSLSDDGINYDLYNTGLIDPNLPITRSPLFNISRDSTSLMKSRLLKMGNSINQNGYFNFDLEFIRENNIEKNVKLGNGEFSMKYPHLADRSMKKLYFYISSGKEARTKYNTVINISSNNSEEESADGSLRTAPILPSSVSRPSFNKNGELIMQKNGMSPFTGNRISTVSSKLYTIYLHDSTHFDISLTTKTVAEMQNSSNNFNIVERNMPESVVIQNVNDYTDIPKVVNARIFKGMNNVGEGQLRSANNYIRNKYDRYSDINFDEINGTNLINQNNSGINLFYKGNFNFSNGVDNSYDTIITIFSEETGFYENIHISIIPTETIN